MTWGCGAADVGPAEPAPIGEGARREQGDRSGRVVADADAPARDRAGRLA